MPTSLVIDFPGDGLVLVNRQLERFQVGMRDLTPAFEAIAEAFRRDMKEQFGTEGGHASGGWKALNPAYAALKNRLFPGKPILQRTGATMESLTGSTERSVQEIGAQEMVIGTSVPWAIFHQAGTAKMPARPIIALNPADRTEAVKLLQEHLVAMMQSVSV